jgi:hypothetical protein
MKCDLGGTAHDARIAGALCQVEVCPGGQPELAALRGDLGKQKLVEDLPGQLLLRQVCPGLDLILRRSSRHLLLRPRGAAGQHEREGEYGGQEIHWRGTWTGTTTGEHGSHTMEEC